MAQLFANAARAYLSAGIIAGDTTISITAGGGLFPTTVGPDFCKAVLQDATGIEIVYITAHASAANTFTVTRGQEGTTARAFAAGSVFGLRVTAADTAAFAAKLGDAPSDGKTYGRKDAAWAEVVAGGGGSMVYLGTVTAANAASADITGLDTHGATYDRLVLICDAVWGSTEIRATVQMNGSWAATSYEFAATKATSSAAPTSTQSTSGTYVPICPSAGGAVLAAQVVVNIYKPSAGPRFDWVAAGYDGTPVFSGVRGFAQRMSSTQGLQGLRFVAATGNVNGVFRLYGIKNS